MKKTLLFLGTLLCVNFGFSQFLISGTNANDNKYRFGGIGLGYNSPPSFGTNKFMVNGGTSYFGGNVGIGTLTPSEALHLTTGNAKFDSGRLIIGTVSNHNDAATNWGIKSNKPFLIVSSTYPTLEIRSNFPDAFGFLDLAIAPVQFGYSLFSKKGDVVLRGFTSGSMIFNCEGGGDIKFTTVADPTNESTAYFTTKVQMIITKTGKIGIGTGDATLPNTAGGVDVSNYKLFVKGGILTEEVRVSTTWADYVFNKDYNLKPLSEVETFIKENGHLPNVPSAAQVKEEGIELGNMAKIQQEKIEELTLYIIEQDKINKKQGEEIEELRTLLNSLLKK